MDRIFPSSVHDRCLYCEEEIRESASYQSYRVCPFCRFHYSLSARQRIQLLADRKSFRETHKYLNSVAPITFSQRGSYRNLVSKDQNRTGLTEATVTGACRIDGVRAMLVVLDFGFMGGSMGSVVGEKIALGLEEAARQELPLVAVVTRRRRPHPGRRPVPDADGQDGNGGQPLQGEGPSLRRGAG